MRIIFSRAVFLFIVVIGFSLSIKAHWLWDGIRVCMYESGQDYPDVAPDGRGGAIVTYQDMRNYPPNRDVYIQRIDSTGTLLWNPDGVALCSYLSVNTNPEIIPDGVGGAIVTWGYDSVLAQRVDPDGITLWENNGVLVSDAFYLQRLPKITTDGKGGAIITWMDQRNGDLDIYAQRVDAGGTPKWRSMGEPVCSIAVSTWYPRIISDDSGGAIIAWEDHRSGGGNSDIYAQRMDSLGIAHWTPHGIPVCSSPSAQDQFEMIADGSGGAIITWRDHPTNITTPEEIRAQRIDSNGNILWQVDGVPICTEDGIQSNPELASDCAEGAIITWFDARNGIGNGDIFAQRVAMNGTPLWAAGGIPVCTSNKDQYSPVIDSDGVGGVVLSWIDMRLGHRAICGDMIDADGNLESGSNGFPICVSDSNHQNPCVISDGSGGMITVWDDPSKIRLWRSNWNIAPPTGDPEIPTGYSLSQNYPNPFNPSTRFFYKLDFPANVTVKIFNTSGRIVNVLVERHHEAGTYQAIWDGKDAEGNPMASGVYYYRMESGRFIESKKMILLR